MAFQRQLLIIGLDPEYRWAAVGEPGRTYLWILSREPRMDPALLESILDRVRRQGYDLSTLIRAARHK